jgi:hypothetical protein
MMLWNWHNKVSMAKSGIRVVGYICLPINLYIAAGVLVAAEVLGVLEELW